MKTKNIKTEKRMRLKKKIRAMIGDTPYPRLSVFRSNSHIYAQVIDDQSGKTIAEASDIKEKKGTKNERAEKVGKDIAKNAIAKGVEQVVFDRNGFAYTGRVKILAEEARKSGLKF